MCKFKGEIDGRIIEGVVKETEEAQTDYEHAIQSGHSAFLLEEKLSDVFKVTHSLNFTTLHSLKLIQFSKSNFVFFFKKG